MNKGPVLIDLDAEDTAPGPSDAPPVPEPDPAPSGRAMQAAVQMAARKPSVLSRWFWRLGLALLTTVISVAAWNFASGLVAANPILGWAVTALLVAFVGVLLLIALREAAAFSRLARVDALRHSVAEARASESLSDARKATDRIAALYKGREELRWGQSRLAERQPDVFDASGLLDLAETELLIPLDDAAKREIETAARQVATVTALVPLALADVAAALTANLRMIRRVAEIYGGRSGTLGSWRLTRAVMAHLVATGAVAVGDDMLEPLLGGGLLGKLSRRFGEGLVNGALTARVGVAAMEVCRPMPFAEGKSPSASRLVRRALGGLFSSGGD